MALTKFNYNSFDVTPVASKTLGFNSDADGLTTAPTGSMVLIKTLTADGSGTTLSFVDGSSDVVLDNTYPIYLFKYFNIHPATDNVIFQFNLSADTGSNYNVTKTSTCFQAFHNEADTATDLGYQGARDLAQGTGVQDLIAGCGNANDEGVSGDLYLFNPSSTTFVKNFIGVGNQQTYHEYCFVNYYAGYANTTSAVDAIQFSISSGNIDDGKIKMYGVSDS